MSAGYRFPDCLCGGPQETAAVFDAPPPGEPRYGFSGPGYRRELRRCLRCGHFVSVHDLDLGSLYDGEWSDTAYGDLERRFARIASLPPEASDNHGRVALVADFAAGRFRGRTAAGPPTVLDVGSGLCVFLNALKDRGFACTALDPDPRAAQHARTRAGVAAVAGDFRTAGDSLGRFDIVTFNKVLEHVPDPAAMLAGAADHLLPGGFVFVELPDGEAAEAEGLGREEFFVDHYHVFSAASLALLARMAGLRVLSLSRRTTPSGKYDLWAFLALPETR